MRPNEQTIAALRENELLRALEQIARMRMMPDDKVNRFTLLCAIKLARGALDEKD